MLRAGQDFGVEGDHGASHPGLAIDQIHPDDAGHAQMARAMISFYAEILPTT